MNLAEYPLMNRVKETKEVFWTNPRYENKSISEADGLAVGRPSGFVGKTMEKLLSGIFTVEDDKLYKLLAMLADTEDIYIEPSAAAGLPGSSWLMKTNEAKEYIKSIGLSDKMYNSSHIIWATITKVKPYNRKQFGLLQSKLLSIIVLYNFVSRLPPKHTLSYNQLLFQ